MAAFNGNLNKRQLIYLMTILFIYLESACHDEQNGGHTFKIRAT